MRLSHFKSYCIFIIVIAVNPADSVFDSGGKLNYLLEVVTLCELDISQIETVALWGTGPVAINVEHRLQMRTLKPRQAKVMAIMFTWDAMTES